MIKKLLGLIGVAIFCLSCGGISSAAQLQVGPGEQYTQLQEAVDAAQSGDRIIVKPGRYEADMPIYLKGKQNLQIAGEGQVDIICTQMDKNVIQLEECENIQLSNLHAQHDPGVTIRTCNGAVVLVGNSQKIRIEGCELNGSGAIGVKCYKSQEITIARNNIHNNSLFGIWLIDTGPVVIEENIIAKNKTAFDFRWSHDIYGRKNQVQDNNDDMHLYETNNVTLN